jgi:hypothetical protein
MTRGLGWLGWAVAFLGWAAFYAAARVAPPAHWPALLWGGL